MENGKMENRKFVEIVFLKPAKLQITYIMWLHQSNKSLQVCKGSSAIHYRTLYKCGGS